MSPSSPNAAVSDPSCLVIVNPPASPRPTGRRDDGAAEPAGDIYAMAFAGWTPPLPKALAERQGVREPKLLLREQSLQLQVCSAGRLLHVGAGRLQLVDAAGGD